MTHKVGETRANVLEGGIIEKALPSVGTEEGGWVVGGQSVRLWGGGVQEATPLHFNFMSCTEKTRAALSIPNMSPACSHIYPLGQNICTAHEMRWNGKVTLPDAGLVLHLDLFILHPSFTPLRELSERNKGIVSQVSWAC